tara:strand:- start:1158 stop:1379 length:222 start_codon:yes stop_codon:yes gene_type:complete
MKTIETQCRECRETTRTEVDEMQLEKYMQRIGLVQDMFPEHSIQQREAILGYRGGYYLCPTCWDQVFAEDEEE